MFNLSLPTDTARSRNHTEGCRVAAYRTRYPSTTPSQGAIAATYYNTHARTMIYHARRPNIDPTLDLFTHPLWVVLSCRYTVRCNRADIAVSVSWYNDIEPWALHGLTHATCHSDWCQRAGYMPTLYKIRGFTQTDSAITLYTRKLWHRRYFLNREVPYWLQSA